VEDAIRITRDEVGYPATLLRLGEAAPGHLTLFGNTELLRTPSVALFCSVRIPAGALFEAFDLARELAGLGITIAGGFQSPIEREFLDYLLGGCAPVLLCPARGIEGLRLPRKWRVALRESRVLIVSAHPPEMRRPTLASAELRNRVVSALATRLLILHASSGGRLARLAAEALGWGLPVHCLDHPGNEDLRLMGATPLPRAGGWTVQRSGAEAEVNG
jgi:predicted Rossmann fold nucleotide-binding protein DprA/Smf involved in DNA uptake